MIPMVDLKAQYRNIKAEVDSAIANVLDSAQFVLGSAVESFEHDFAAYCGTADAVAVNSGTSALHIALLAAGVKPGDEVVTVPFTFIATVAAIEYAGAQPVLVDIDPDSYTMDPAGLEKAITPRTRAIVPVHLFGQPADMDPINAIARSRGIPVIEDAAQAHGAEYYGRRVGTLGDIACFSFYPAKNLGAYGEGGAAVTSNPEYAKTMRLLRSWGEQTRYEHRLKGFNYRMDGIQGAVLGVKLRHLDAWNNARRGHAAEYDRLLAGTPARVPTVRPGAHHIYHAYTVRLANRDLWRAHLSELGIQTGVHYPIPAHLQPAYADLGYREGDFPASEMVAREVLSLPCFPEMSVAQIEAVAGAIRARLPAAAASSH